MAIRTVKNPVAPMGLVGDDALYPKRTLPIRGHEDSEHLGYSAYSTSNHMHVGVACVGWLNFSPVLSLAALQALNMLQPVC